MARYTDAVCRLCRREGEKLYLKGTRCTGPNCSFDKKGYAPGEHGARQNMRRRRESDYNMQLRAKQKARRIYGVYEKQFRRYFREATRAPGLTGDVLVSLLERRLDNVVYRLGYATSRAQARQLVTHGHFDVNGRRNNIPSYTVAEGDVITVRPASRGNRYFSQQEFGSGDVLPSWLAFDPSSLEGRVLQAPRPEETPMDLNVQLIVEYYSAR